MPNPENRRNKLLKIVFILFTGWTSFFKLSNIKKEINQFEESKTAGHELREIASKEIAIIGSIFCLLAIIMHLIFKFSFFSLLRYQEKHLSFSNESKTNSNLITKRELPPEPRLQTNPQADFKVYVTKEKELLSTYGWVDPKLNKVRIPVDLAIKILAKKPWDFSS